MVHQLSLMIVHCHDQRTEGGFPYSLALDCNRPPIASKRRRRDPCSCIQKLLRVLCTSGLKGIRKTKPSFSGHGQCTIIRRAGAHWATWVEGSNDQDTSPHVETKLLENLSSEKPSSQVPVEAPFPINLGEAQDRMRNNLRQISPRTGKLKVPRFNRLRKRISKAGGMCFGRRHIIHAKLRSRTRS